MEKLTIEEHKELAKENHLKLKNHIKSHKGAYIFGFFLGMICGIYLSLNIYDAFIVDKIRQEAINNKMIVECFYNKYCEQKIQNLDFTKDNKIIIKYATAYKIKQYIADNPKKYNNFSNFDKQHIESILLLTK